jgi:hypothetical protein
MPGPKGSNAMDPPLSSVALMSQNGCDTLGNHSLEEVAPMAHVRVLEIDIAKQIFHIVGMDDTGTVVLRNHCPRGALMSFIAKMPPVVIEMEACGGAHYW